MFGSRSGVRHRTNPKGPGTALAALGVAGIQPPGPLDPGPWASATDGRVSARAMGSRRLFMGVLGGGSWGTVGRSWNCVGLINPCPNLFRQDGAEFRDPQFTSLLGDIVDALALDRREQQPKVGFRRLGPKLLKHRHINAFLRDMIDCRAPFPIASIEQLQRRAVAQPHDITQIVRLLLLKRNLGPIGQIILDIQPRFGCHGWLPCCGGLLRGRRML